MPSPGSSPVLTPAELKRRLDAGETLRILDVRNEDEFARWRVEARRSPLTVNVPYFHFVEDPDNSAARVPRDLPLVAICAKGDSSAWVAESVLRPMGYEVANLQGGMQAWGSFYDIRRLPDPPQGCAVWQVERPARGCLHYVAAGKEGDAVAIDPPRHLGPILDLARAEGLTFRAIVDTHAHADHLSGGPALARVTSAPYFLHPYDGIHPVDVLPARIDFEWLEDGHEFRLGEARLRALHVPGHTLGMTAMELAHAGRTILFSGDSIFLRSIARPDLGGRGEAWAPLHYRSLYGRLRRLPEAMLVLPGHFSDPGEAREDGIYAATLGDLKGDNPELRERGEEEFVRDLLAALPHFPPEYLEIKRVNAGLAAADEERANELEMGRNECAASSHGR
ncbi:MAG TPA: MBL fold metallo-hydrolase [Candidatus Polarisedimenticolia bacterium]|nr:MBL fold metallo-hydrolase [Candidatus Polarisedimenticolia bacterium]